MSRVLHRHGIGAAFYAPDTLKNRLVHLKDKLPINYKSNVVYQIDCHDCDKSYVGKTIRNLGERTKEHSSSVRLKQPEKSALAKHCLDNNHEVNTERPKILTTARNDMELITKEAIYIQSLPNLMNNQEGHQYTNLRLYSRSMQRYPPS